MTRLLVITKPSEETAKPLPEEADTISELLIEGFFGSDFGCFTGTGFKIRFIQVGKATFWDFLNFPFFHMPSSTVLSE